MPGVISAITRLKGDEPSIGPSPRSMSYNQAPFSIDYVAYWEFIEAEVEEEGGSEIEPALMVLIRLLFEDVVINGVLLGLRVGGMYNWSCDRRAR